jgi:hypothetical protein
MEELCENGDGRPVNRDGVCFACKIKSVRFGVEGVARERKGKGPGLTGYESTSEYVRQMYAQRRKDGLADPVPANKEAAKFAPAAGVMRDKKYKEANNGL